MGQARPQNHIFKYMLSFSLLIVLWPTSVSAQTTGNSGAWSNRLSFPNDELASWGSSGGTRWVKFAILLEPFDANVVYFQDSKRYQLHYSFAINFLEPFVGMAPQQFNSVTLLAENQQAVLGAVLLPPLDGPASDPETKPLFDEYGIQFVRQEPYTPEEIVDLFFRVKNSIDAPSEVQAFYFPSFEQQAAAIANQDWFASQGVPVGSSARWAEGNICYSQGWALGTLKYVPVDQIDQAYQSGQLTPYDILLTDGIPAELPYLAGILSLVPSTPNSHVAILARTYTVPFLYLALEADAQRAQQLVGHRIIYSAYDDQFADCDLRLIDTDGLLDDAIVNQILELKQPAPLDISPITPLGAVGISTEVLHPNDINIAGGKAANFSVLRSAIPGNSPRSIALTFDVWNAFLDQPLQSPERIDLLPGEHILIYADEDESQGSLHAGFKLDKDGESIALYDTDGVTLIDVIHFSDQDEDMSYGRVPDGSSTWQAIGLPTPGTANGGGAGQPGQGLVINEFMADNDNTLQDPDDPGDFPDWIELYNASDQTMALNGLYLTDDVNEPTKWRISSTTVLGPTLRQEIADRLAKYPSYPPVNIQQLKSDLAAIRNLFIDPVITQFSETIRTAVLDELSKPEHGFDPYAMLRFRSSTNVEDSADFTGAGLYESYSGCLADELDNEDTICDCDPNRTSERGVFEAIRKTFASFYNDNAYLERLRRSVDEDQVGMAVLVHHSFPDEIELANGVATMEYDHDFDNIVIHLVTQKGAVSVTNPMDASLPEAVTVEVLSNGHISVPSTPTQYSNLVPLGDWVMDWRADYTELSALLTQVYDEFGQVTGKADSMLDLEYKKVAPGGEVLTEGGLVVKQVRQLPEPNQVANRTPFLINEPTHLEVYTGEVVTNGDGYDVFAHHRLKSRWTLETKNTPLDSNTLDEGFYTQVTIEYLDEDQVRTVSDNMANLPSHMHEFIRDFTTDSWELMQLANPRTYHLRTTNVVTQVSDSESPILTLTDFGVYPEYTPFKCLGLTVDYESSVISLDRDGNALTLNPTSQNSLYLWSPPAASENDLRITRKLTDNGVTITTTFYFPPPLEGQSSWIALGATGPLLRWESTTIEGLTSEPIILSGYFSQTYKPEHHNLVEHFLFEARLEPNLPQTILDELQTQDIRFIHLVMDNRGEDDKLETGDQSEILTYGFDLARPGG